DAIMRQMVPRKPMRRSQQRPGLALGRGLTYRFCRSMQGIPIDQFEIRNIDPRVTRKGGLRKMHDPGAGIRRLANLCQNLALIVFDVSLDGELTAGNAKWRTHGDI